MKFRKTSSKLVEETSTSRVKSIANGTIHKPIKIRRTPLGISGEKSLFPKVSNGLIGTTKLDFNKNEKPNLPVTGITTEQLRARRNIKAKIQTLEKQIQEDRDHIRTKIEQKLTSNKANEVNVNNDPPLNLMVTIKPRLDSPTSTNKHAKTTHEEVVSERQVSLIDVKGHLSDESDDLHLLGPNDSAFLNLQSDRLKTWRLTHEAADPLYNEVEYMLKLFELHSLETELPFYVRPRDTKSTSNPSEGRRFGEAGAAKRVRPDDWSDEGIPSKRR